MIVKESNDTTRNFGIDCKYSKEDRRDEQECSERSGPQQFKSKMDQLEEEKRRIEEDVAQSKRRTNMIVELNDANALRDRSNTCR
jgi:hypothetical protein